MKNVEKRSISSSENLPYDASCKGSPSSFSKKGEEENCRIEVFQSNHEGAIIDRLQDAYFDGTEGIVINPGAYTHYSYAIRDALSSITTMKKVEVHISDINQREEFRKHSYISLVAEKQIKGHGFNGYLEAIDYLYQKYN